MSQTLTLDSPYFKCYKIAYQVLDPMTCLLFGWLLNEVNMSSCEDGYGSYVFRSKREIRAEFFRFSERQFNRAWKKLTEDRLIWTDRKRYGFKIYIASNALSILTRKQEELRKNPTVNFPSEDRHSVRHETGNSGPYSGSQNRQRVGSPEPDRELRDTMEFRHSDGSPEKAGLSQCRTSIPIKEQNKLLEETPLEPQRQTTGKDLCSDESFGVAYYFHKSRKDKSGRGTGHSEKSENPVCASAKSDTVHLSEPMNRYLEPEEKDGVSPENQNPEETGFPDSWNEIYASLEQDEPPVDWGSFPQWERDCDEWTGETESFAPEEVENPEDPGSSAPEAVENPEPVRFAPEIVENPAEFADNPIGPEPGKSEESPNPAAPSCLPHSEILLPDLPAGKAVKTAIASVPVSSNSEKESPAKPDSDFGKLLDAKHQLKAEAEKERIPLDEQERQQWKIEEDKLRKNEQEEFWKWMETHPDEQDPPEPEPESRQTKAKTPPGTRQPPFVFRRKRA